VEFAENSLCVDNADIVVATLSESFVFDVLVDVAPFVEEKRVVRRLSFLFWRSSEDISCVRNLRSDREHLLGVRHVVHTGSTLCVVFLEKSSDIVYVNKGGGESPE